MAQSLARLWTHLIFSTKDRFPFLTDKSIRRDMHAYLATILRKYDCETLIVGGVEDHTHSLFALSRMHPIATVVKETNAHRQVGSRDSLRNCEVFIGKADTPPSPSVNPICKT